ncbi:AbrB/MazE/SpoVT family DNA-binding domain-containing protein [Zooshikella marina]|uniref:AbrB/MazE/SpoVT family DNA-binding domain-containing protein n=1 Tax=Zooshikella ganghwensis TaxID=202772 RepID=UPI001BB0C23D|nr:AbrB/MazE/SpoVT family DNA-binding domain-containing protein [Zooshikella ganghwensis]MBU2708749.1 AbrB/MazE/SpoVT family DNA-binding domain-containing protein [Zooshikella ganghwensis]
MSIEIEKIKGKVRQYGDSCFITIPVKLRRQYEIDIGDYIEFDPQPDKLHMYTVKNIAKEKGYQKSNIERSDVDIVRYWRQLYELDGKKVSDAVEHLNDTLGKKFTTSRFSDWQTGKRSLSIDVVKYLAEYILPELLQDEGYEKEVAKDISSIVVQIFGRPE